MSSRHRKVKTPPEPRPPVTHGYSLRSRNKVVVDEKESEESKKPSKAKKPSPPHQTQSKQRPIRRRIIVAETRESDDDEDTSNTNSKTGSTVEVQVLSSSSASPSSTLQNSDSDSSEKSQPERVVEAPESKTDDSNTLPDSGDSPSENGVQPQASCRGATFDAGKAVSEENEHGEPESEDECLLLGVHQIIKKPPLAVITISSDDEEEDNVVRKITPTAEKYGSLQQSTKFGRLVINISDDLGETSNSETVEEEPAVLPDRNLAELHETAEVQRTSSRPTKNSNRPCDQITLSPATNPDPSQPSIQLNLPQNSFGPSSLSYFHNSIRHINPSVHVSRPTYPNPIANGLPIPNLSQNLIRPAVFNPPNSYRISLNPNHQQNLFRPLNPARPQNSYRPSNRNSHRPSSRNSHRSFNQHSYRLPNHIPSASSRHSNPAAFRGNNPRDFNQAESSFRPLIASASTATNRGSIPPLFTPVVFGSHQGMSGLQHSVSSMNMNGHNGNPYPSRQPHRLQNPRMNPYTIQNGPRFYHPNNRAFNPRMNPGFGSGPNFPENNSLNQLYYRPADNSF